MRWAWAVLVVAAQASPEDEYKQKLAQISKTCAAKHYSIGEYLSGAQMHLWAREQYNKVVEFDPDHEGARRKLGYKKGNFPETERQSARILSLPIHQHLTRAQLNHVVASIRRFYRA